METPPLSDQKSGMALLMQLDSTIAALRWGFDAHAELTNLDNLRETLNILFGSPLPKPFKGFKRQWLKCRACGRVQYYDYQPYSLSNPIRTTACGHGIGDRDLGCDYVSVEDAIALMPGEDDRLMTSDEVMDEVKRYFASGQGNPALEPVILEHYAKTGEVVHAVRVSLNLEKVVAYRRK
jgi:hypothetical protein